MSDINSPIPSSLRELLTIFCEHLTDVRFGDIDRGALEEAAARVVLAAQKAADAEAALTAARAELAETQQALATTGQRAFAYAKIYAETSPELLDRLNELSFGDGGAGVNKTREVETRVARRRARKDASEEMPALPGTVAEASLLAAAGAA